MSAHDHDDRTGAGHETTDASVAPLVQFAVYLAVLTVLIAFFIVGLYRYLDAREIREKGGQFPLAVGQGPVVPPPPRLQTYPFDDVKALHREERRYLDDYAWVDKNAGVARIPVERAIDLLAERGLPHRSAAGAGTPAAANEGH